MAGPRIFVSFAIEDKRLRDMLIGQARNPDTPFEITDYSVKEPWNSSWKTNCRARIRSCRGVIGIVTRNTPTADGQLWELQCATSEVIPLLLMYGSANDRGMRLPVPIADKRVYDWTWANIAGFINRV